MPKVNTLENVKVCPECGSGDFNEIKKAHWDYECEGCLFYWTEDEVTANGQKRNQKTLL